MNNPTPHLRGAAQYVKDVFDHFGADTQQHPTSQRTRFRLFDAPWNNGEGKIAGQEDVQEELYRLINNFVREGRVSKLLMLHGPNGSAKSSIVRCIQSAMEIYSQQPEGALYSYAWIFPSERIEKGKLGFGSQANQAKSRSYAHLPADDIDARLPCQLREPPIFFIPTHQRISLFNELKEEGLIDKDFIIPRYLLEGELSPRDRAIYDALLLAYDGDHTEVLRHVQVERFYISRKYGRGVATIEPQMHVDADTQQLTADRSIANLPRSLQTIPMFDLGGPLVSANRGLLEYSDLLKRPIETFKYLLTTSEEATASLPQFSIHLDQLLVASSNELHLAGFKQHPDWNSFKGRIELIRVPYLRTLTDEVQIYLPHMRDVTMSKPIAPYVIDVISRWAVLTRLEIPDSEKYPQEVQSMISRLTPSEKLDLYNEAKVPGWVSNKEGQLLQSVIPAMFAEHKNADIYEGQFGASAREIKTILLRAAQRLEYKALTPLPIFDELQLLVSDKSLYDFLKREPRRAYYEYQNFIDIVRNWWLDIFDHELRQAMGLVEEARHSDLFAKYVRHVSALVKGEKLVDKYTDKLVSPDVDLLKEIESVLLSSKETKDDFREAVIGRIGAWSLENPGIIPDYKIVFPRYIERIEEQYFKKQRKAVAKNLQGLLDVLAEDTSQMTDEAKESAQKTIREMDSKYKYAPVCTAECAAHLLKYRYANEL